MALSVESSSRHLEIIVESLNKETSEYLDHCKSLSAVIAQATQKVFDMTITFLEKYKAHQDKVSQKTFAELATAKEEAHNTFKQGCQETFEFTLKIYKISQTFDRIHRKVNCHLKQPKHFLQELKNLEILCSQNNQLQATLLDQNKQLIAALTSLQKTFTQEACEQRFS